MTASVGPTEPSVLAEEYVPLVANLVRELSARIPGFVDRDDLRSAGLVALVTAARSFDSTLGVPFAAYATRRVRGALLDELRSIDWASRAVRRRSREIEATRQRLANEMGAFPDDAAVAKSLGLSAVDVAHTDADVSRAVVLSLHTADYSTADQVPAVTPSPAEIVELAERMDYLVDAIEELPERLRAVVRGYFLEERPMTELATELGVSDSRISQMRAEALVLLRGALAEILDLHLAERTADPVHLLVRRRAAYADAVAARHAARRDITRTERSA